MFFRHCLPGTFMMGGSGATGWNGVDRPQHEVKLTRGYYLAECPVTVGEFGQFVTATGYQTTAEIAGKAWRWLGGDDWQDIHGINWRNPGFVQTAMHPVVCISHDDAIEYIKWLNQNYSKSYMQGHKVTFRLPTEAEWEYACRAGTQGDNYGVPLDECAWYAGNSGGTTHEVRQKKPNNWGLYDMLGNVWEWTADWYGNYPQEAVTDPVGVVEGRRRVLRGGLWCIAAQYCNCAHREADEPNARSASRGFRVAFSVN